APRVLIVERVRPHDGLRLGQIRASYENCRRIVERFDAVLEDVGVLGFCEALHAFVEPHEPLDSARSGRSRRGQTEPPVSGLLRPDSKRTQIYRLARID